MPTRAFAGFLIFKLFRSRLAAGVAGGGFEASGLLLGFYGGLFVFHCLFEVLDSFAQTLGDFRDLLAAKQQHCHSKYHQEFGSGKATKTSSLKALRKHTATFRFLF